MCKKRKKNKKNNPKKLSQFLKLHISGTLKAILLKFGMWSTEVGESVHSKNCLVHQGSTELQRCENCVFYLPLNILTDVARRLLGPHDTLPCVLISLGPPNENFTFHRVNIFFHWIFMDKISSSERGEVIVVSIDRSIIRRKKNGGDLVTYHGVLVPPYS